jgi:predicted ATPase
MSNGSSPMPFTQPERVRPLAELVIEKTAGNPFFVVQFSLR